jgi:cysteine synthase A
MNREVIDQVLPVDDVVARDTSLALAREEGIFVGISAGGTFAAALKVAEQAPAGSSILAMLPDTGERYLSTFLFEDITEESDDGWLASLGAA